MKKQNILILIIMITGLSFQMFYKSPAKKMIPKTISLINNWKQPQPRIKITNSGIGYGSYYTITGEYINNSITK